MDDIITLSSDDENTLGSPPKKKIKRSYLGGGSVTITPIPKVTKEGKSDVVVLSDDEDLDRVSKADVPVNNELQVFKNIEEDDDDITIITDKENRGHITDVKNGPIQKDLPLHRLNGDSSVIITEHTQNTSRSDKIDEIPTEIKDSDDEITIIENQAPNEQSVNEDKNDNTKNDIRESDDDICEVVNGALVDSESLGLKSDLIESKENKLPNEQVLLEEGPSKSINTSFSHTSLLERFLNVCEESCKGSHYHDVLKLKFPILWKFYKKCESKLGVALNFKLLLESNITRAAKTAAQAVISFSEIFHHIKEMVDMNSIEVSENEKVKLKKLEKTIKLLVRKIQQLEAEECDLSDEEDSSYLKLHRYTDRLNKVYCKYCEVLKKNPHSGRLTYSKLDFVDSEFNEINRAINKKYKNNKKFPSYIEMENYISKVANENNLQLSDSKIKSESAHCFKKLGELLQNRRKRELYNAHYLYIRDSEDPANKDTQLGATLKENYNQAIKKIEKLCQEYVRKEELGEEAELSEDSDKSNYVDSENENDQTDTLAENEKNTTVPQHSI